MKVLYKVKLQLDSKSLDRFPGTKSRKPKELPFLVASEMSYGSQIRTLRSGSYFNDVPAAIHENDWIPSKVAALVVGISKQAISDRIKRGTIPARDELSDGSYGRTVKMVRLMECRKKKRAGRPKGSTAGKVKGLKREGFEIPVYFICNTTARNGQKKRLCHKQVNGHIYEYTDSTFTQEIPDPDRDTIPMTEAAMFGNIEAKRRNTYCHRHKCESIELSARHGTPGTTFTNWSGCTPQIKLVPGKQYWVTATNSFNSSYDTNQPCHYFLIGHSYNLGIAGKCDLFWTRFLLNRQINRSIL